MFHPITNGTKIEITKELTGYLPPKPNASSIAFFNEKKSNQFWRRQKLPDFWQERAEEELFKIEEEQTLVAQKRIKKVTHFDPVLEKYRRQQWNYRYNGYWFYNEGVPTYLTGTHWLYLQWCRADHIPNDSYPFFYKPQLKRFYFRKYCEEDPLCLGYVILGERSYGKSTEEVACLLDSITKPPHRSVAVIQSMTEKDSKIKIFRGKIVPTYNDFPDFFKPESNHGSNPESKLSFFRPAKSGQKAKKVKYSDDLELRNVLYPEVAKAKALDGETIQDVFTDEIGKTDPKKEANVHERNQVLVDCVWRNNRKVGMIRATSTVEDMDKGGKECYMIWKESDPKEKGANGRTISGLYRLPVLALETASQFADKFGNIDQEKAMAFHTGMREQRMYKPAELVSWIRKHPLSEDEFWLKSVQTSTFNSLKINDYLNKLRKLQKPLWIRGDFHWKDEPDGDTYFDRDDHSGLWQMTMLPDAQGNPFENIMETKLANNVGEGWDYDLNRKLFIPKNNNIFGAGGDPIKFVKTKDPRASTLSVHFFLKYNDQLDKDRPIEEWKSNKFIGRYNFRSEDPRVDFENVIKAIRHFGCSINLESNVSDMYLYMEERGYGPFITKTKDFDRFTLAGKKDDNPLQSHPEVIQNYINKLRSFSTRHFDRIDSCPFEEDLEQMRDFDPSDITKFHDVVSMGFTLIGAEMIVQDEHPPEENISKWFDSYDNSENISKLIEEEEDIQWQQ